MSRVRAKTSVRRVIARLRYRRVVGALEIPAHGATVPTGRLELVGWALPRRRPIGRIEVRIDGVDAGYARPLAMARPDVARRWRAPSAPLAGYTHTVTITGAVGARVRLDVDVVDIDGKRAGLSSIEVHVGRGEDAVTAPPYPARATRTVHRPLRVMVFTHQLDLGGGQLYLQEVLRALVREPEFSFSVVSAQDGVLRAELEALGVEVHIIDYPVQTPGEYEARIRLFEFLARTHDPDVVLVNTMSAGIGADMAGRVGLPAVWAIHESYTLADFWVAAYGDGRSAPEVRACLARALAATPAVLFEADATRSVYATVVPSDHTATLPYGVSTSSIDDYRKTHDRGLIRRSLFVRDDAIVLLCMGTFEPRKAQCALAVAFAEVSRAFPDLMLVLVGDIGKDYAVGLREVVQRLDLGDRIRLEPVVEDHFPWYLAADAFVIASDVESMPRTLLEAMAFGLPVAATSAWGMLEVIRDGENGLLFEARDVGALRDALARLLSLQQVERERLGAAAARTVADRHDAASYIDAYRRLLPALAEDPDVPLADVLLSRAG